MWALASVWVLPWRLTEMKLTQNHPTRHTMQKKKKRVQCRNDFQMQSNSRHFYLLKNLINKTKKNLIKQREAPRNNFGPYAMHNEKGHKAFQLPTRM